METRGAPVPATVFKHSGKGGGRQEEADPKGGVQYKCRYDGLREVGQGVNTDTGEGDANQMQALDILGTRIGISKTIAHHTRSGESPGGSSGKKGGGEEGLATDHILLLIPSQLGGKGCSEGTEKLS